MENHIVKNLIILRRVPIISHWFLPFSPGEEDIVFAHDRCCWLIATGIIVRSSMDLF